MRLGPIDCGCDDRRDIMFRYGKLGLPEAAVLAAALLSILLAWKGPSS